jgi:hypothetical protein
MALPSSGTITMDMIRIELGVPAQSPFGLNEARSGTYATINPCSTYKPPSSGQISLTDWYGYDQSQSCGPSYDIYYANEFSCFPCTLQRTDVLVAFPAGTGVTFTRYYNDISFDGFVYRLTGTASGGPAIILTTTGNSTNCNTACSV